MISHTDIHPTVTDQSRFCSQPGGGQWELKDHQKLCDNIIHGGKAHLLKYSTQKQTVLVFFKLAGQRVVIY